ncbi:MAG: hypothetical protein NE328_11325 [Lentisphaeraceae bacterium]|nr:hypothetical protein [Lentisphaeraceae bacterium]
MKKGLIGLLVLQVAVLGYFVVGKSFKSADVPKLELNITVITPDLSNEKVVIDTPPVPVKGEDPFNFEIPDRRLATQGESKGMIDLDKNINALSTFGEAFMENPIVLRGIEKAIRRQFYTFYGDFVKEADLTPEQQIELFKLMSETMQSNFKSFMTELGKNMGKMEETFKNGPPPELIEGIMTNNLAMKENMIANMGQEKFELFEQYHKEKSAAESFNNLKNKMKREKTPLSESQETDLRGVFINNQASPFQESSYTEGASADLSGKTGDILDEKQQKSYKGSRKKSNRLLLMPF